MLTVMQMDAGVSAGIKLMVLHGVISTTKPHGAIVRRGSLVFGLVDGLTLVLGLILGNVISHQAANAIWHSALGGGVAELGGMSLGQYWSSKDRDWVAALLNGGGCCAATLLAGMPFAIGSGAIATIVALTIIGGQGAVICLLREEGGMVAVLRTFGLLLLVGLLSGASGFL